MRDIEFWVLNSGLCVRDIEFWVWSSGYGAENKVWGVKGICFEKIFKPLGYRVKALG